MSTAGERDAVRLADRLRGHAYCLQLWFVLPAPLAEALSMILRDELERLTNGRYTLHFSMLDEDGLPVYRPVLADEAAREQAPE